MTNKQNEQTMSNEQFTQKLEEFATQYGEYMFEEIQMIGIETSINYIPLRNHVISVSMLQDDNLYNEFSDSEKFQWKNNFLTNEQEKEHMIIMSQQFVEKCYEWLNNNTELLNILSEEYTESELSYLFDSFIYTFVWKDFVGDCFSIQPIEQ